MKRLSHVADRTLPAQGWRAFACSMSGVAGDSIGLFAVSQPVAQRETLDAMVPGEGSV